MQSSLYFGGTHDDPLGSEMVYLGGPSYGLTIPIEEIPLLISVLTDTQDVPYGYGGTSWGAHHPSKIIPVPVILQANSWTDNVAKVDALNLLLDKNRLCALRFDCLPDRYWLVRLSRTSPVEVHEMGDLFTLEFTAPDPRAYSTTETTQTVAISGNTTFNVPLSGVLAGTAEPDVLWLLKPTGSGATNPVVLENTTRDETLTWANTLTSAEWLELTAYAKTEKARKTADSGGSYSAVNSSIQSGSRFPKLSAGVANACALNGFASTGSLVITYRARFN